MRTHSLNVTKFFNNGVVITVLRKPEDAIASIMAMKFVTVANSANYTFRYETEFAHYYKLYLEHLEFYLDPLNNVHVFKFEEVTENSEECIKTILNISNNKNEKSFPIIFPKTQDNHAFIVTSKDREVYKTCVDFISKKDLSVLNALYNKVIGNI
jgi:hypothetical protein